MSCPQIHDVVAVFLDGDAEHDPHGLAKHLAACPDCQQALGLARRLDAALASSADVAVDPELAEHLLQQAVAPTAESDQTDAGLRLRPLPLALAAAALVLVGVGIGYVIVADHGNSNAAHQQVTEKLATAGNEPRHGFVPLPELPSGLDASTRRPAPRMLAAQPKARMPKHLVLAAVLRDDRQQLLPVVLPALAAARAPHWHWLRNEVDLMRDHVREQAGRKLLQSARAGARQELLAYLALGRQDPVLERMLVGAADDARFVSFVRGELRRDPEGLALVAAARLGEPGLDRLLRDACRGKPARSNRLAAALASIERRAGRTGLLLDLWQSLQDRGLVRDAGYLAERWFRGLPAVTTLELATVARSTGKASRRRQCITALGARRDSRALPYLLDLIAGPRHGDAVMAAHALAELSPADVDAQLLALHRRSRRPHLLLAALAGMRSPRVQARIQAMELTAAEREFLATGRFNPEQFTLAARLFRERRRLSD